jgi:hypothetical protein
MAIEPPLPRSRRAVLTASLGGLAALVATALGRPEAVRAGTDGDVVLGASNSTLTTTELLSGTADPTLEVVSVYSNALTAATGSVDAIAVNGHSANGIGVLGRTNNVQKTGAAGWSGWDGTGLVGYTNNAYVTNGWGSFPATPTKTGVYGLATQDGTSNGVYGRSTSGRGVFGQADSGRGVFGQASSGLGVRGYATSGVGLSGEATTGYALRTSGRIQADKVSGVARIGAGATAVTVTPGVDVTSASFVLLTPKTNIGSRALWFTTDATNNRFTIRISSSRTSSTYVAWLLVG